MDAAPTTLIFDHCDFGYSALSNFWFDLQASEKISTFIFKVATHPTYLFRFMIDLVKRNLTLAHIHIEKTELQRINCRIMRSMIRGLQQRKENGIPGQLKHITLGGAGLSVSPSKIFALCKAGPSELTLKDIYVDIQTQEDYAQETCNESVLETLRLHNVCLVGYDKQMVDNIFVLLGNYPRLQHFDISDITYAPFGLPDDMAPDREVLNYDITDTLQRLLWDKYMFPISSIRLNNQTVDNKALYTSLSSLSIYRVCDQSKYLEHYESKSEELSDKVKNALCVDVLDPMDERVVALSANDRYKRNEEIFEKKIASLALLNLNIRQCGSFSEEFLVHCANFNTVNMDKKGFRHMPGVHSKTQLAHSFMTAIGDVTAWLPAEYRLTATATVAYLQPYIPSSSARKRPFAEIINLNK